MDHSLKTVNKILRGLIFPLSLGFVIGFLFGIYKAARYIYLNEYFEYGMYNISLFIFRQLLTKWSLSVSFMVVILYFGIISTYSLIKIKAKTGKKSLDFLVALVMSCAFFLTGAYLNYRFVFFGFYTPRGVGYIILVLIFAIILMLFLKWFLFKINYEWARRIFSGFLGFEKKIRIFAASIFAFLMILNIISFSYKNRNIPHGPNVLLIVVDTLRSDHLGSYGYKRNTSPNIDQLAKDGILFKNSISQAPWTLPSVATILTSLYPSAHQAKDFSKKLSSRLITLPEILMDHFYETGGIISGDFVSSHYGFNQGFGFFDEKSISGHRGISSRTISKKAIKFMRKNRNRKFFLFLHYFDPHFNYILHKRYNYFPNYNGKLYSGQDIGELRRIRFNLSGDDIDYLKALYDAEISFTDEHIGLLFNELKKLNLYDNTMIIVTADHGEEFMERGWLGHSTTLYSEQINVPLILRIPNGKMGLSVDKYVGLIDIMPTIMEISGIEKNGKKTFVQGINLLGDDTLENKRVIFSEVSYMDQGIRAFQQSAVWEQWKIRRNMKDNSLELYNIKMDKDERNDLSSNHRVVLGQMKELLAQWETMNHRVVDKKKINETVNMEEELKSRLRSLGYIN
jgi:arylsulfatase A-like enzyme